MIRITIDRLSGSVGRRCSFFLPVSFFILLLILSGFSFLSAQEIAKNVDSLPAATWEIEFLGRTSAQVTAATADASSSRIASGTAASDEKAPLKSVLTGTGLVQLRNALYSKNIGHSGIISGVSSVKLTGTVVKDQLVTVALDSNPSTGYRWEVAASDSLRFAEEGESRFEARSNTFGSPMVQYITLRALEDGEGTVGFVYLRPFDPDEKAIAGVTIDLAALPRTVDLSSPAASAPSVRKPVFSSQQSPRISVKTALPSYFDWRDDQGGVTKVKDQKACGACWAFATVGTLESSLRIKYGLAFDLSEQFLVSCNWQVDDQGNPADPWGCSGGNWAHDWHLISTNASAKLGTLQTIYGAVFETDMKYQGDDAGTVSCKAIKTHPFWMDDWTAYSADLTVDPPVPFLTPDQIKQLVYDNGPIGASICSGPALQAYKKGVFNTDESTTCSDSNNHVVLIVGWNDVTSTWIIKNSWGTSWGEKGYANVQWYTSNVGLDVSYISNASPNCTYTILPETTYPKTKTFKYNGGSITLNVTASAPICPAPRITTQDGIDYPASGGWVEISGTTWNNQKGTVRLKVLQSQSSITRNMGLRIGRVESGGEVLSEGELYEIKQSGAPCTVKVSPTSQSFTNVGGSASFNIITNVSDCQWVAGNAFDYWLHASMTGTGSQVMTYSVDGNSTGASRSGKITVTLDQTSKKANMTVRQSK